MINFPGNIPIRIHPFFWLLVAFISAINSELDIALGVIWAAIIVISVVVHELGHALSAKAYGQRVAIDLVGFGGITSRFGAPLSLGKEFIIVACGPLAGLMLGVVAFIILKTVGVFLPVLLQRAISITYVVNIFWTIVNLLPVQPLDGGQLLRITLEGFLGLRGIKAALFISFTISAILSLYFLILGYFLFGAFLLMFTFEGFRGWKDSLLLTNSDRDNEIQQLLKGAEKDYKKDHFDYALEKLNLLLKQAPQGVINMTAKRLKSEILFQQGRFKEAYELLLPLKRSLSGDSLQLLHELAFRAGDWREAVAVGNAAYQYQPNYEVAVMNALSYAILGEVQPSVGWLQCAVKEGLPNLADLINKREFDAIRGDPLFQNIVQRCQS